MRRPATAYPARTSAIAVTTFAGRSSSRYPRSTASALPRGGGSVDSTRDRVDQVLRGSAGFYKVLQGSFGVLHGSFGVLPPACDRRRGRPSLGLGSLSRGLMRATPRLDLSGGSAARPMGPLRFERTRQTAANDSTISRLRERLEVHSIDELDHVLQLMCEQLREFLRGRRHLDVDEEEPRLIAACGRTCTRLVCEGAHAQFERHVRPGRGRDSRALRAQGRRTREEWLNDGSKIRSRPDVRGEFLARDRAGDQRDRVQSQC